MSKSGSNAESYIWYAAYGSNVLRERFMCYLEDTEFRAENGTILRAPPKCDVGTRIQGDHPFNDQSYRLPFKLYFACDQMGSWWSRLCGNWTGNSSCDPWPSIPADTSTTQMHSQGQKWWFIFGEYNKWNVIGIARNELWITTDREGMYCVLLLCGSLSYKDFQVPVVILTGCPEKSVPRNSPSITQ